jgi:all-trans-8'-apo-beta-carotenal 15,15'-oxygenase
MRSTICRDDTVSREASFAPGIIGPNRDERDLAPGLDRAFQFVPEERSYTIEDMEGEIPSFIAGSYYLNGPARFARGKLQYRHWLDGDGMITSLRFRKDGVHFTNRFVRTNKFIAEEEAGHPIFRTFGTAFPGDALKRGLALESPGNVSVYPFQGRLLAFGEQALPWEIDAVTLRTVGQFDFGGSFNEVTPFSGHPKFDPATGEMFNFGIFFSGSAPQLCVYCFDQDGKLRRRTRHPLEYSCSVHDFSLSANYLLFYLSPYLLDIDRVVRGGYSLMDSLSWEPERGGRLVIVSRQSGNQVASLPLYGRSTLHLINSFEEDRNLILDIVEFERPIYDQYTPVPALFVDPPAGGPVRLVVDLHKRELISRSAIDYPMAPDFPSLDPNCTARPYRDFWMLGLSKTGQRGRKFFDQLAHARWDQSKPGDVFQAAPGTYLCGEPVFIGDTESGPGCVLCQAFTSECAQSSFLIFDAFRVSAGPVAALRLKEPIPFGFHGCFEEQPAAPTTSWFAPAKQ